MVLQASFSSPHKLLTIKNHLYLVHSCVLGTQLSALHTTGFPVYKINNCKVNKYTGNFNAVARGPMGNLVQVAEAQDPEIENLRVHPGFASQSNNNNVSDTINNDGGGDDDDDDSISQLSQI